MYPILFAISFLVGLFITSYNGWFPVVLMQMVVVMSTMTFLMYGADKIKAHRNAWRISESTLHFWALLGGWPGAVLAQQFFRHKSKKVSFRNVFWITVFVNCCMLVLLITKGQLLLAPFT